jgi:hypothetical protein
VLIVDLGGSSENPNSPTNHPPRGIPRRRDAHRPGGEDAGAELAQESALASLGLLFDRCAGRPEQNLHNCDPAAELVRYSLCELLPGRAVAAENLSQILRRESQGALSLPPAIPLAIEWRSVYRFDEVLS